MNYYELFRITMDYYDRQRITNEQGTLDIIYEYENRVDRAHLSVFSGNDAIITKIQHNYPQK